MNGHAQGGYIGLIALMLSVVILGFLFMSWYNKPLETTAVEEGLQPNNIDGTTPTTQLENYQADIDAARAVQDIVDLDSALKEDL